MFKFKGHSKGIPAPTILYFKYHESSWTLIGTFNSKFAAKLYAYEHGHSISNHDITWRIEPTHVAAARQRYYEEKQTAKQNEERRAQARIGHWIAQDWYNFYTEKYGEDLLK
jgi:hypothetical protein